MRDYIVDYNINVNDSKPVKMNIKKETLSTSIEVTFDKNKSLRIYRVEANCFYTKDYNFIRITWFNKEENDDKYYVLYAIDKGDGHNNVHYVFNTTVDFDEKELIENLIWR